MSRSGYTDDYDGSTWDAIRWSGAVKSAMRGKRGQAFLRELIAALDALPEKVLIAEDLVGESRNVCALGSVGLSRGMDMSKIDPEDWDRVANAFEITPTLAREIMYHNDEGYHDETSEQRWTRVCKWAVDNLTS